MNQITRYFLLGCIVLATFACNQKSRNTEKSPASVTDSLALVFKELAKKIESDPENDMLYIERAKYYLAESKIDSALRDILFAIDINNKNPEHFIILSDAYLDMGNPDKCIDGLNKALQLDPANKEALLRKGRLYMIMRNYQECYQTIDQLLKIDGINPVAHFIKGFAYLEQGDTTNAIKNFLTATEQNQQYFDPYLQLGMLYSAQKNPLAVEYLNAAITLQPMALEAYYQLALFFQENGNEKKAITTYQNILNIDPNHQFSLYNLGYIYLVYLQDFAQGAEYFTRVIELNPEYAEAYYNRGYCYELSGKRELAKKDYQKTLDISANYPKAIEGLNRLD